MTTASPTLQRLPIALGVLTNLIPLYGVWSLGWSLFGVFVLYWLETAIIGSATLVRVLVAGLPAPRERPVATALFFGAYFGAFWMVHGAFVYGLFRDDTPFDLRPALIAIAVTQVSALVAWTMSDERRQTTPMGEAIRPMGRVMVLHVTLIAGGWWLMDNESPFYGLVLLIVLKTALDVATHWGHDALGKATSPAGA